MPELEVHVTVSGAADVAALRAWAGRAGWRCIHIVLERGRSPSQPMLNRRVQGELADAVGVAREAARELAREGFAVVRVKVEAGAASAGPGAYYEHHVKLALAADAALEPLVALAVRHRAHLSRNALRARDDGRVERFVTQRVDGDREAARQALAQLMEALAREGHPVLDVEEERVIFDSDGAIDDGWLTA